MSTSDVRFAETAPGASLVAENGVLDPLATPAEIVACHDVVAVGYVPLTGCHTLRSTATEIRDALAARRKASEAVDERDRRPVHRDRSGQLGAAGATDSRSLCAG